VVVTSEVLQRADRSEEQRADVVVKNFTAVVKELRTKAVLKNGGRIDGVGKSPVQLRDRKRRVIETVSRLYATEWCKDGEQVEMQVQISSTISKPATSTVTFFLYSMHI
jgi:hypothetical protein